MKKEEDEHQKRHHLKFSILSYIIKNLNWFFSVAHQEGAKISQIFCIFSSKPKASEIFFFPDYPENF